MSLSTLPFELIDGICHNLDTTDLVGLSRTSSVFHPVAQRLLYRNVSVSSGAGNLGVIVTLAKRPHIATHVRSLSIVVDDEQTPLFRSFYRPLAKALASMSGLTCLSLLVDSGVSWVLGGSNIEGHTVYNRLKHFTCSFPLNSEVVAFLDRTPALLELEVDSTPSFISSPTATLSPTSIPHLTQFIGSSEGAKEIVPGRPVESVHLYNGDLTADGIARLSQSTAPVVALGAKTSLPPAVFLDTLGRHLPFIAFLRVMADSNDSVIPNSEFYQQIANKLDRLPHMAALELCGIHWGSSSGDQKERVWQARPPSPLGFASDRDDADDMVISEEFLLY